MSQTLTFRNLSHVGLESGLLGKRSGKNTFYCTLLLRQLDFIRTAGESQQENYHNSLTGRILSHSRLPVNKGSGDRVTTSLFSCPTWSALLCLNLANNCYAKGYVDLSYFASDSRFQTRLLLILLLIGITLRIFHIFDMADSPIFDQPVMDPGYHDSWARSIVAGSPITDGEPYFRAPLYPWFLAAIYQVGGGDTLHPRVVQALLGALSLFVAYRIGRRLFRRETALTALFLSLLYPLFPYFDGELLITPIALLLDLVVIDLLLLSLERERWYLWLLAGAALGLSALARPNVLLFAPAVPIWLYLVRRGGGAGLVRAVLRPTLLVAAGTVLLISPVTVRNVREGGDLVWIASQGGINFYLGNHPGADGWSATAPGIRKDWEGGIEDSYLIARRELGREPKASEVSSYWYRRGWDYLRENPGEGAAGFLKKSYLLLHGAELSNNQIIPFAARYSRLFHTLPLGYGLIVPLALLGIALGWRDRRRSLLLLFLGLYSTTIILFFVCSRYRMPLVPILLLYAASALIRLGSDLRRRRWRGGSVKLAVLAGLILLLNTDFGIVPPVNLALGYEGEGLSLMEQGENKEAAARFREAIRHDPGSRNAHHDLGVVLRESGDTEGAIESFRRSLEIDPRNPEAYNNLALTLSMAGRGGEAAEVYREGIAADPRHPGLHVNLAVLLQERGEYEAAAAEYRSFLLSGIRDGRVHANLGLCLIRLGREGEGEAELRKGVGLSPTAPGPPLLLAEYLAGNGRDEEARVLLREASERMPGERSISDALAGLEGVGGL